MALSGPIWALGAMSGTSLDGVDAALLETDGEVIYAFGDTGYRPYSEAERGALRAGLGLWPGEDGVQAAAEVVETAHAELLSRYTDQAELVGFHGQTLAHDPGGRGTHQAGDGVVLAAVLGLPVVWDFRSSDVELGGQGAPLAPFYHFALARWMELSSPVAFLNLGGVGNVTWADPRKPRPEAEGALLAFDTGPANAPINDLMLARRGAAQDAGGVLAAQGTPDAAILDAFLKHPYFHRIPPKSLDRDAFAALSRAVAPLPDADAAATLTAAAAAAVAAGCEHFPLVPEVMLVSGGGRHNMTLMAMLAERVPFPVVAIEEAGFDGDMIEAQAFAHLAVRVLRGLPTSCPTTTGVAAAVGGGQLSRPEG
ncbi:anhydro-N-acetylmuramic acid kinase [Defluviimonas sp. 20V17]|uniref:Anhydro-N-acetylmuramic acid kinase n=1 Tax=Allgaiera indica TaxID=765699 RepID=A0AAN4UUX4_9RHOB|nr:anhydro-N-acetylmuramic acid kinase [Allgaiera indica]KDB05505.1 anhydro-N-acetylmuramic acid kinase [Defluviimonas sp. 20V17]GHE04725.1 anhydro-N-acetylmuramic acid kinase [Allgaiera indica]SDX46658.1 anhydro-N-acetylmuramic acid kinase [Allgaiera indica]